MRKRYVLLKETPELKVGAILEEKCDDGTQGFGCIDMKEYGKAADQTETYYTRKTVMENPRWFKEVEVLWLTPEQIVKVKKLLKI